MGKARATWRAIAVSTALLAAGAASADTLHVDDDAPPGGDGLTWETAYRCLQDALDVALAGDDLRVAQGVYYPDEGEGRDDGNRFLTFTLEPGVRWMGGYAGVGAADPDARDTRLFETVLSGDLDQNDGPDFANNDDNSVHVIRAAGLGEVAFLDGLTITAGNANLGTPGNSGVRGAGLDVDQAPVALRDCVFRGNYAVDRGAGAFLWRTSEPIENCVFVGNVSGIHAGAAYLGQSFPLITGCRFLGNETGAIGGGAMVVFDGRPIFAGCEFAGNHAIGPGGALRLAVDDCSFINCTMTGNVSASIGGAIADEDGPTFVLANTIVWDNSDANGNCGACQISIEGYAESLQISYCNLQNIDPEFVGPGNFDAEPMFVDALGPDGVSGTLDDDLHLSPDSPCINTGNPLPITGQIDVDIDGDDRVRGCRTDVGADESGHLGPDCDSNGVPDPCDPDCNGNGIPDDCDLSDGTSQDCDLNLVPDFCDITLPVFVDSGALGPIDEDTEQSFVLADVQPAASDLVMTFTARGDLRADNEFVSIRVNDVFVGTVFELGADRCPETPDVDHLIVPREIFNDAVLGAENAVIRLDPGPRVDPCSDSFIRAMVAYRVPDVDNDCNGNGIPDSCDIDDGTSRDDNGNGVPDECEGGPVIFNVPADYPTIGAAVEASFDFVEIVLAEGIYRGPDNRDIDLGGKLITIRSANGPPNTIIDCEDAGRAFIMRQGEGPETRIAGLTITRGRSTPDEGGGISIDRASPTIEDCVFRLCVAGTYGSAIAVSDGAPLIRNCRFDSNAGAGAIGTTADATPTIEDCLFINNGPGQGAALYFGWSGDGGTPIVRRCRFLGNTAGNYGGDGGGAAYIGGTATPEFFGCVFAGNDAGRRSGAGIFVSNNAAIDVDYCVFYGNGILDTTAGGGIMFFSNSAGQIRNSAFWANIADAGETEEQQVFFGSGSEVLFEYNCIEGWSGAFGGVGNFGLDPLFVEAAGADGRVGTQDDNLHLTPESPCIDAGDPFAEIDPDERDADGDPRVRECRIDVGVDETPYFVDCDDNGVSDACELLEGEADDCNLNRIPDKCEPDCDMSGVPDVCELGQAPFRAESGPLSPIRDNNPQVFVIESPPTYVLDDALLHFVFSADLNGNAGITIRVNGMDVGLIGLDGTSCPDPAETDDLVVPRFVIADAAATGRIEIEMQPFSADGCGEDSFIMVTVDYLSFDPDEDCDGDGVPDECEIDCNENGIPDECELRDGGAEDCNGNSIPDDCDTDCNGNGMPDDCDVAEGTSPDCNGNGVPDECDVALGTSDDCDENGIPDECDVVTRTDADSGELSPIGSSTPQTFEFDVPRPVLEDVTLSFTAFADLASSNEFITIDLNGTPLGDVFAGFLESDCPDPPDVDSIIVTRAMFNDITTPGVPATLTMTPSSSVSSSSCGGMSYIRAVVSFTISSPGDCNVNGVVDACEGVCGADITDDCAVDFDDVLRVLAAWGDCPVKGACPEDLDGDGMVGYAEVLAVLATWGPCT